jgi:competence transcription factor ComK
VARASTIERALVNQTLADKGNAAYFMPTTENKEAQCWWIFTEICVKQM